MSIFAQITGQISWYYTNDDGSSDRDAVDAGAIGVFQTMASGLQATEATGILHRRASLVDSIPQTFDIWDSIADQFGETIRLYKVKHLVVTHRGTNAAHMLRLGGSFLTSTMSNGTDLLVYAGGTAMLNAPGYDGYGVTDESSDDITLLASGGNFDVDMVIVGIRSSGAEPSYPWNWSDGTNMWWSDAVQGGWSA